MPIVHPLRPRLSVSGEHHGHSRPLSARRLVLFGGCLALTLTGCKDLTGSPGLPAGTPNPSSYNTPAGALGMRNAAVSAFEQALPSYVVDAGLLTDELEDANTGASAGVLLEGNGVTDPLDERILPEGATQPGGVYDYQSLQGVREFANQAIGALATYDTVAADTATGHILRGELYAMEGYAEIMLADLFCSGVPLSTLDFQKDFTYHAGSTWSGVDSDAVFKFDTALAVAAASDSVVNLARVGRGRAWLDLGQYDSAAAAVAQVPTGFQYRVMSRWVLGGEDNDLLSGGNGVLATVSDREGSNGLPFLSSGDPRSTGDVVETTDDNGNPLSVPQTFPVKYAAALTGSGYTPFTVADAIEAQLITAEQQLQPASAPSGPWLGTLNRLREAVGLHDTTDPGTAQGRIALLFQERAYGLFLTGHRQGDLRRLLRQYSHYFPSQQVVYPTGLYLAPGTGVYGSDVTAPIPTTEYANPLYHGCLNRIP